MALSLGTEVPVVTVQVPWTRPSVKNDPEHDAIQAGAMEELKLAL